MTYDNTTGSDECPAPDEQIVKRVNSIGNEDRAVTNNSDTANSSDQTSSSSSSSLPPIDEQANSIDENDLGTCYNPVLDNEIRARLDKLNALSNLINSLERQSDEANSLFRETLRCSTERLSSIARTLGTKSIKYGRVYQAAKLSVEQSQSDCQRACVQFEQANNDHQLAKKAIKEAEQKLQETAGESSSDQGQIENLTSDLSSNLRISNNNTVIQSTPEKTQLGTKTHLAQETTSTNQLSRDNSNSYAARMSEELNLAIMKLVEAEQKRCQSEKYHMDQANKLMIAQENLLKLERQYGNSIKRSQLYFEESRQFNARLNSVKSDICRLNDEIMAAKQAYASTLRELEQFSEELHEASACMNR